MHFSSFFTLHVSRRHLLIEKIWKRSAHESLILSIVRLITELEWACHRRTVVIFIFIISCDLNQY